MNLEDVDVVFNRLNRKCVNDMVEVLSELNLVYSDLKKEDEVSFEDSKNYIYTYRNIVELYHIGSRKQLKDTDVKNDKTDDDKLKIISELLYGNTSDDV